MVDTNAKQVTRRSATARSIVVLPEEVLAQLVDGAELRSAKGGVFQTAILAGIMAAKKPGDLIPLCHPLGLEHCHIEIRLDEKQQVLIDCTAVITAKTGVEMEALVGASIAALTVYRHVQSPLARYCDPGNETDGQKRGEKGFFKRG